MHLFEHLAHALGRDLDAVAFGHFLVAVVFARQVLGDRLEAVARDLHARSEVHHRGLEHQLVGGLGLDQDDVHPRVALLPTLCELMQALVCDQLEGLVADLRKAHVRDAPATRPAQGADRGLEVVDEGHDRVDHHDELGPRLDRDVEVGGRDDPAVDQLAILDPHGRVDHRQRSGGTHGGRDRDIV